MVQIEDGRQGRCKRMNPTIRKPTLTLSGRRPEPQAPAPPRPQRTETPRDCPRQRAEAQWAQITRPQA